MKLEGANETDVREEIASPFLTSLGYERGTENDILREFSLSYNRVYLGRKKTNDPPLRGRADYILSVTGAARWILEVKGPSEDIGPEVMEQAISYARHPEISGAYAVVLNGKRLVMLHASQHSRDPPLVDIEVTSPEALAKQLAGLLSPAAIRRDCSPPVVDLGLPLSDGLRSSASVVGGHVSYTDYWWECGFPLPNESEIELTEMCRRLRGYRAAITGGRVWRDDSSRVKAKLIWALPHEAVYRFAEEKRLLEVEYVSLNQEISSDAANPTIFDVVGDLTVKEGETLFDIVRWETKLAGVDMSMNYRGQAIGHIDGREFKGHFVSEYEADFPAVPELVIGIYGIGTFEVLLGDR